MTNIYNKEENEIKLLINSMLSSDIQNKQQIEKIISELSEKDFGKILNICHKFIKNENEELNIQYYSLTLVNNLINKENGEKFISLNEKEKNEIRANYLALLGHQSDLIRQYSCMIVASLGFISKTMNQKEWPNLIPLLCNGCNSKEKKFKLSAIKTLNMIWEKFPSDRDVFTAEELILMEGSLVKIMTSPSDSEIALESIKAYQTFMNYISNKFENTDYLKNTLHLIIQFCKISDINTIEVIKCGIHCITEITKIAYEYMGNFMTELFKFFGQSCVGKDEEIAIQSYIYFIEISLEELDRKKNDEKENENDFYNKNYIQKNWNILFFCIKDTIQNYNNDKNNLSDNGEYTRYKALFPLINNITQLCNENTFEEIYKYIFKRMNDTNPLVKNSAIYIFHATLETNHEYIIIKNLSKIIPSLCQYLTINCPILNNTVGDCLEKICERFGSLIIGDKSLLVQICYNFAQLLISEYLKNKPKINICLCFCHLCNYIKTSNLQHLGLISPYLNNLFVILDTLAYLPFSYEYNINLSYYCFLTIAKLLKISTENDKFALQNYFQKFNQRLNEAKEISNFDNDKEKQYNFQDYLCACLNEYCNEGNNNANLEIEHIIHFFKLVENYFELRKEIFESGLLSLIGLISIFSKIRKNKNENEYLYIIDKGILYIKSVLIKYKDIQNLDAAFLSLRKIIQVCGKRMEYKIQEIIEIFEKLILSSEQNFEILGKILLIFSDFLSKENNVIWNYLEIGLNCMKKLIDVCMKEHENFILSHFNYDNFRIYVNLNDYIIEFIEEVVHKILSEKQNLKEFFKNYLEIIMKYLNLIFSNKTFKPQEDFVLSSINTLIYLLKIYKKKAVNLIQTNTLNNLNQLAEETKNNNIITTKIYLLDQMDFINNSSINKY